MEVVWAVCCLGALAMVVGLALLYREVQIGVWIEIWIEIQTATPLEKDSVARTAIVQTD
jgi:hypothetical protein